MIYAFLSSMAWFFLTMGLSACHGSKAPFESESKIPTPLTPSSEASATPLLYSETELQRGSVFVQSEDSKRRCPAVLVARQLMILPHTCPLNESKLYSLHFSDPKTHQTAEVISHLSPMAVSPVSQTRSSYQPQDFFLVYEIKEAVPPWVEPIRLLPSAQVSRAFEKKKSVLLLLADGVRTMKTHELKVERYFIYSYLPQTVASENLMLVSMNGRLYLAGGAKVVNGELFWVNLTSFSLIQELISNP